MERLTEHWGEGHLDIWVKDHDYVSAAHRLAAYEDSGIEPEEVLPKDKADEIALKLMRLADLESLCSYTSLRELAEADKDGRLVVLPCKVGGKTMELLHLPRCAGLRLYRNGYKHT